MKTQIRTAVVPRLWSAALSALLFSAACEGAKQAVDAHEQQMKQGLAQLYQSNLPVAAQETFRAVLQKNPSHYGAHYQLAVALDRGGSPIQARAAWEEVRKLADAITDTATLGTARRRLASPDTVSQEAMMALGLDMLHRQADFAAAVTQFRAVLHKNPTHYGATYQLATALDRAGRAAEARPVWQRMLGMATQINDQATMQTARDRLK